MLILGIDTALESCSAALSHNGELLSQISTECPKTHAEVLPPMVQDLLAAQNIKAQDIGKIGVTVGPGSFTGVRIGISFAKSLALGINCPCVGLSTLEVLAHQSAAIRAIPVISMAGSVFTAAYEGRNTILPPNRAEDFSQIMGFESNWVLCGPAARRAHEFYPDLNFIEQEAIDPFILIGLIADLAPDIARPTPLYLRGADAKKMEGFGS